MRSGQTDRYSYTNIAAQPFKSCVLTDSFVNEGISESVSSRDRVSYDTTLQQSSRVMCQLVPTQAMECQATCFLGQQIPPINKFSGENLEAEGEVFQEWIQQFELIAELCGWNNRAKLVNLTTCLRGQAYQFLLYMHARAKADYSSLKAQLERRFTPVHIQAVHSNLFHHRKQAEGESVDAYLQELCKLFYKAYPRVCQGNEQAEDLGHSVLGCQFVAGLNSTLRIN